MAPADDDTAAAAPLVLKAPEGKLDVLVDLVKVLLDLSLAILECVLELHGGQLIQDLSHGVTDDLPSYLQGNTSREDQATHTHMETHQARTTEEKLYKTLNPQHTHTPCCRSVQYG